MNAENSEHKSIVINSNASSVDRMCKQLLSEATSCGFDEDQLFAIHLAVEEAFLNAVKHGNRLNAQKKVTVEYVVTPEKFEISITDQGSGFDPDGLPDPRRDENLYKSSGRGVLIIRSYMDIVEYNRTGNSIHMVKHKAAIKNKS
jgi:serine/threonine-protein kinase RsbW